jgi:hypothetical protein
MVADDVCNHKRSVVVFERGGSKLHPRAWMVERCEACDQELDRRSVSRSWDGAGAKGD